MALDERLQARVETAADAAYTYVADFKGLDKDLVPRSPECRLVTASISFALYKAGVKYEIVSRGGEHVDEHRYLVLGNTVVDATWKQFIPESDADDLPDVFIGSREHLQDMAETHGAKPWAVRLWDEEGPRRALSVEERIAEAYDKEMGQAGNQT